MTDRLTANPPPERDVIVTYENDHGVWFAYFDDWGEDYMRGTESTEAEAIDDLREQFADDELTFLSLWHKELCE